MAVHLGGLTHLILPTPIAINPPVTLACRFEPDALSVAGALLFGVEASSTRHGFSLGLGGTATLDPYVRANKTFAFLTEVARSATPYVAGVWQTAIAVFADFDSAIVYLDNVPGLENTANFWPNSALLDQTVIGAEQVETGGNTFTSHFSGCLADVAAWNIALTADHRARYQAGFPASSIAPDQRIGDLRMLNVGSVTQNLAGPDFTLVNAVTVCPAPAFAHRHVHNRLVG